MWRCKALPSAVFLVWRVMENRIATRVNLVRRGVVVENPVCCLCGKVEESSSHLFSVCDFSWRVWCLCLSDLECHSLSIWILCKILSNSSWVRHLFQLMIFGGQFGLKLWVKFGSIGTRSSLMEEWQMC